jgi:carboxymethylenebutenolidase
VPVRPARWNSIRTDTPITSRGAMVEIGPSGDKTHAYLAQPGEDAPRPGVVFLHHVYGWDEFYWEASERLARHGYDVMCPDLYCRYGHGTPPEIADLVAQRGGVRDDSVTSDCAAAAQALRALPTNDGQVAIMGACSGGRHAVLAASLTDAFDAAVDFWGGGVIMTPEQLTTARPVAPVDYTERLTAPLLGVFGVDDTNPSPDQVDAHERELQRLGKDYTFHRLEGAGHGFFHYHQARYKAGPAIDAWNLAFDFLGARLKGRAPDP